MNLRKAITPDTRQIYHLIKAYSDKSLMLEKPLYEIYENIRDFNVIEHDNKIVACCALELYWEDLSEIRSLAVHQDYQGRGLGRQVVKACLAEANTLVVKKVFCLTYQENFFKKMGFVETDKNLMPQKIWAQCIHCSKFPNCNEICLIKDL